MIGEEKVNSTKETYQREDKNASSSHSQHFLDPSLSFGCFLYTYVRTYTTSFSELTIMKTDVRLFLYLGKEKENYFRG